MLELNQSRIFSYARPISVLKNLDQQGQRSMLPENEYLSIVKPNVYTAPGYDPNKLLDELLLKVHGTGGHIEQSLNYVDPVSARAWMKIAQHQDYQAHISQSSLPIASVVESIRDALLDSDNWDKESLEVVLLGPADAKKEIQLVKGILEEIMGLKSLYICLIDISQPLLHIAKERVASAFLEEPNIFLLGVEGDFRHLPLYRDLFYKPPRNKKTRLIVMLGYTFSNLSSEIEFVRDSLGSFRAGDMFLADFGIAFAPAKDREQILEKDPYLQSENHRWRKSVEEFIIGPFKRYREGCKYVEFSPMLDNTLCPVDGSYCIELRVTAVGHDESEHSFRTHRIKRYDPKKLVEAVCAEGWEVRNGWVYGPQQDRALSLWRKR